MLRLLEIGLFVVPFAIFLGWRLLALGGGPSVTLVAAVAGAVLLIAAALFWFSGSDTLGPGQTYIPARLQDGRVVPGHAGAP